MYKYIKELNEVFYKIKEKKYIKTKKEGFGGIGNTFETLLGKEEENFFLPDYNGIEIKTMREKSKSKLHLFNATPDGDYLFPIKRTLNILGYPDKINKNYKVLNIDVNALYYSKIGLFKKVKLYVNKKEKKIELIAKNNKNDILDVNVSWSYNLLEERLNKKLKYLALVKAKTRVINNEEYFYYDKINFFKIKDFDTFIKLINKGIIIITFKIGVFRSGKRKGEIHDRGTGFSIDVKDLKLLYEEIKVKK